DDFPPLNRVGIFSVSSEYSPLSLPNHFRRTFRMFTDALSGCFRRQQQTKKFRDYADEYMKMKEDEKSYDMKRSTRLKVIEYFGDKKVDEITRLDVKRYLNTLMIKETSKRLYLSTIKGVLDVALDDEMVKTNVTVGIQFKRTEKIEVKPFSNEEVQIIIESAEGALKNYLGIAFYTGMRSGEILGLMHQDITEDTISIKRSVSKGKVTTPKTHGSIRTIPMFERVRPFIEDQIKRSKSLYLFDYEGHFISDISVFRKRKWHKLLKDLDIEYRKIYYTRHSFITAMLNSNQYKLLTVAKIVGHSSIETLMSNYAGFIKDDHLKINIEMDIFCESFVKVPKMMKI
ncbi:MAG: tyrosine-type recombinase/integrase, partial [Campylobacterales bacterium]|nr:tyrosine-type recombinase/integrase [Campylobacterales bacterium]